MKVPTIEDEAIKSAMKVEKQVEIGLTENKGQFRFVGTVAVIEEENENIYENVEDEVVEEMDENLIEEEKEDTDSEFVTADEPTEIEHFPDEQGDHENTGKLVTEMVNDVLNETEKDGEEVESVESVETKEETLQNIDMMAVSGSESNTEESPAEVEETIEENSEEDRKEWTVKYFAKLENIKPSSFTGKVIEITKTLMLIKVDSGELAEKELYVNPYHIVDQSWPQKPYDLSYLETGSKKLMTMITNDWSFEPDWSSIENHPCQNMVDENCIIVTAKMTSNSPGFNLPYHNTGLMDWLSFPDDTALIMKQWVKYAKGFGLEVFSELDAPVGQIFKGVVRGKLTPEECTLADRTIVTFTMITDQEKSQTESSRGPLWSLTGQEVEKLIVDRYLHLGRFVVYLNEDSKLHQRGFIEGWHDEVDFTLVRIRDIDTCALKVVHVGKVFVYDEHFNKELFTKICILNYDFKTQGNPLELDFEKSNLDGDIEIVAKTVRRDQLSGFPFVELAQVTSVGTFKNIRTMVDKESSTLICEQYEHLTETETLLLMPRKVPEVEKKIEEKIELSPEVEPPKTPKTPKEQRKKKGNLRTKMTLKAIELELIEGGVFETIWQPKRTKDEMPKEAEKQLKRLQWWRLIEQGGMLRDIESNLVDKVEQNLAYLEGNDRWTRVKYETSNTEGDYLCSYVDSLIKKQVVVSASEVNTRLKCVDGENFAPIKRRFFDSALEAVSAEDRARLKKKLKAKEIAIDIRLAPELLRAENEERISCEIIVKGDGASKPTPLSKYLAQN